MSTSIFGQTYKEQLNAVYSNIKIKINGKEIIPKNSNGKVVDPFRVEGTTYLLIRAVSQALGKPAKWDQNNNTVIIDIEDITNYGSQKIKFKDKPLEETVRSVINKLKGDILKSDLESITELPLLYPIEVRIENIEGIEHMVSLETIDFWRHNIKDISALSNLTNLETLSLIVII